MSRKNGGIIGPANTPVGGLFKGVAGGVWRMNDVANFVGNSQWPTGPQSIDNSLRFDSGSSDYLVRTPSSATNQKTFTFSTWVKRISSGSDYILSVKTGTGSSDNFYFGWRNDQIQITSQSADGGTTNINVRSNQVFRDFSAWYHLVCAVDTTQGTSSDRLKLYVNGSQVTSLELNTYPSQNDDIYGINGAVEHAFGRENYSGGANYHSYYLAETVLIDGLQLDPTSFGETDTTTGIWKPKKIGSFTSAGDNSFYLDFKDSSNVGKDASGLSNNFTVNNLTSIDQSTDTCVVNFATLNSLNVPASNQPTFSDGNLTSITNNSTGSYKWGGCSTIGVTSGKWYCEAKATVDSTYSRNVIGITGNATELARTNASILNATYSWGYYSSNGTVQGNGSGDISGYSTSYTTGDIIGVAMDLDNNKLYFSKNGTFLNSGNPASGSTGTGAISIVAASTTTDGVYFFAQTDDTGTSSPSKFEFNFGSPPYSISSGNADANGFGNFEYAVPSGYYALNTTNLNTYG